MSARTILLFLALISAVCVSGQDYYPQEGGTVKGDDDITFKVVMRGGGVILLSNVTNTRTSPPNLYYKDGRKLTTKGEYQKIVVENIPGGLEQAVRATFSERELGPLRRLQAVISVYYVATPEGEIVEVSFIFGEDPEMLAIAPSKLALLEKNIKKYVKWTLNDFAKQLTYVRGGGFIKFHLIELDPLQTSPFEPLNPNPTPPLPPDDPEGPRGPRGPGDGPKQPETGIGGTP